MRRARPLLPVLQALMVWACDATEPSVPTTVSLEPSPIAFDAEGARDTIVATVLDQRGDRMGGVPLTWSVEGEAVTVTPLGGDSAVVTSSGNGSAIVRAIAQAGATGETLATVTQTPATLVPLDGLNQRGIVNAPLPRPLRVAVRDRLGSGIPGVTVTFDVTQGEGAISATEAVTDAEGTASVEWTLGTSTSTGQEVTVATEGLTDVSLFSAIATPGPVASIEVVRGADQSGVVNQPVSVTPMVLVIDEYRNPVPGVMLSFQVTLGGGTVNPMTGQTAASGVASVFSWRLGPSPGPNALRVGIVDSDHFVSFEAVAASTIGIAVVDGANQAAMAGTAVPVNPSIMVRDTEDRPAPGVTVLFTVVEGDGTVTNATTVTDADGLASTGWTLGPVAMRNRITARAMRPGIENILITFEAAGCSGGGGVGYAVTLCYRSDITTSQQATFENATARWSNAITGDLPNVDVDLVSPCPGTPGVAMPVDDLLIFVSIVNIDGPGGVLGQAGPCRVRGTGFLPYIGLMLFDRADVQNMASGTFQAVILHEMSHVIGVGTLWDDFGLVVDPSTPSVKLDSHYSGPAGKAAFDAIGGTAYIGGQKVPVENEGGQGTMNSHWRESVLTNELMTGFINSGSNPLSVVTIRSLEDLGYTVNPGAADPFTYTPSAGLRTSRAPGETLHLVDDILDIPLWRTDASGQEVRVR